MSIKLKALGLGLLAIMAMGAFSATNAGAIVSGHFAFGAEDTFFTAEVNKSTSHNLHFVSTSGQKTGCDISEYKGTHKDPIKTATSLTIIPRWEECYTTPHENQTTFDVFENGCHLVFTSRALPEQNDGTLDIVCQPGQSIVITHPNCSITVVPQTAGGVAGNGITYTADTVEGVHSITMNVKVKLVATYHTKICIFLGTNQTLTLEGSVTVTGFSNAAHTVRTSITAT